MLDTQNIVYYEDNQRRFTNPSDVSILSICFGLPLNSNVLTRVYSGETQKNTRLLVGTSVYTYASIMHTHAVPVRAFCELQKLNVGRS
jgi:hypothetical protein